MPGRPGGNGRGRGGRPGGGRPGGRRGGGSRGPRGARPNTFSDNGRGTATATRERPESVELPAVLTVKELADAIALTPIDVIKVLIKNGMMATINQEIDFDTAAIVAEELGVTATEAHAAAADEDAA